MYLRFGRTLSRILFAGWINIAPLTTRKEHYHCRLCHVSGYTHCLEFAHIARPHLRVEGRLSRQSWLIAAIRGRHTRAVPSRSRLDLRGGGSIDLYRPQRWWSYSYHGSDA